MRFFLLYLVFFSLLIMPVKVSYAQEKVPENTTEKKTDSKDSKTDSTTKNKIATKAKIRLPINREQQFKNDIRHYIKSEKITPLLLGSDDFITLISEEKTGTPKGVAILLTDWQQAATSPKAINFLRKKLPDLGWTTITIQSMTKPKDYPSIKAKKIARIEENKKTLTDYKNKLSKIITKVMKKAANYPGLFLVIAEGSNAALLVNLYQQFKNKQPDVLVILSGHLLSDQDNKNYVTALANINVPVLNLYLENDNAKVLALAPSSRSESKKQLKVYYRQQQLNNITTGYYPNNDLLKAINGWLKHIGW